MSQPQQRILNYIIFIIILLAAGILYSKYQEKQAFAFFTQGIGKRFEDIQKYLLDTTSLEDIKNNCEKKPLIWIHVPHEYNARHWLAFGSRSSHELNQPYLYACVRSIIQHCDQDFKILFIDDSSFGRLLPDWNINMNIISQPLEHNVRQLGIAQLLHTYGGMLVPISFLCTRNLAELYNESIGDGVGDGSGGMFVCENVARNIHAESQYFYPSNEFMGCTKESPIMKEYISQVQMLLSTDYTAQAQFNGTLETWLDNNCKAVKLHTARGFAIKRISGIYVGTKTINDKPVLVDDLLSQDYIQFYDKMYGIWIPAAEILQRTQYQWFARQSLEQILHDGNNILSKYIILAVGESATMVESFETNIIKKPQINNNWVSFWRVPVSSTLPVYGLMPQGIGNNVPRYSIIDATTDKILVKQSEPC